MIRSTDVQALEGAEIRTREGERIGRVRHVHLSEDGTQPLFVAVRVAGTAESLVPLGSAELRDGVLLVAFDRATIMDAPVIDVDDGISDDEQGTVFDYYDSSAGGAPSGTAAVPAGLPDAVGPRPGDEPSGSSRVAPAVESTI